MRMNKHECVTWECRLKDGRKCVILDLKGEFYKHTVELKICKDLGISMKGIESVECVLHQDFDAQMLAHQAILNGGMCPKEKLEMTKRWSV